MHVDEYILLEKDGVQFGVGSTKSGLGVVLYASKEKGDVSSSSSDKYKVVATNGSEVILSSLTEDLSISDTLASMEGDVVFAALDLLDKSSIIGRKKGERIEVWRYQRFDGFGHMIAESTESTPVAIDWYDDFSSFSSLLWEGLDGYNELIVDVEGGVRRFKK